MALALLYYLSGASGSIPDDGRGDTNESQLEANHAIWQAMRFRVSR